MRDVHHFIQANEFLTHTARAAQRAAKACRDWELGGSSGPVGETAELALSAADGALQIIQYEDDVVLGDKDPGTRRTRLVLAGYMLIAAGTDEHGESADLNLAARIFRLAAIA